MKRVSIVIWAWAAIFAVAAACGGDDSGGDGGAPGSGASGSGSDASGSGGSCMTNVDHLCRCTCGAKVVEQWDCSGSCSMEGTPCDGGGGAAGAGGAAGGAGGAAGAGGGRGVWQCMQTDTSCGC